jgi:hypothetical protein
MEPEGETGMAALVNNPHVLEHFGRLMRLFPVAAEALRRGLDSLDD